MGWLLFGTGLLLVLVAISLGTGQDDTKTGYVVAFVAIGLAWILLSTLLLSSSTTTSNNEPDSKKHQ